VLFNSLEFALFLPLVFLIYWYLFHQKLRLQNFFILIVSYVFYGWWDWKFLTLIFFSSLVDYSIGIALNKYEKPITRKLLLWLSVGFNLGLLGFFKYYNFFIDNFISAFTFFGNPISINSLNIILPVGISFYTFQTLSYSIDVFKRKISPTKDFIAFAAFVSFFPQLVAGPIERASNLLPQFFKVREFSYQNSVDGLRQILWGIFKKIVIADNCAEFVNIIFNNPSNFTSLSLIAGAILFSFQIYCDFSGYSDIAIGVSKLLGFKLMQNFAFPYFSRDIAEFWRRWHISLSTWFRDYLYIPLGGSKGNNYVKIRNTFIIFIVSGFWHGANWTFIIWGLLNALMFLPLLLGNRNRKNLEFTNVNRTTIKLKEMFSIVRNFMIVSFAWIFFRAENLTSAINYVKLIFNTSLFQLPKGFVFASTNLHPILLLLLLMFFILTEWAGKNNQYALENLGMNWARPKRFALYYTIIFFIFAFQGSKQEFIYFQF